MKNTALSITGGVLLSHAVAHAVPSALKGLTSVFGMGTGVSPSLSPPKNFNDYSIGKGNQVGSGVYFCTLSQNGERQTKKLLLLR